MPCARHFRHTFESLLAKNAFGHVGAASLIGCVKGYMYIWVAQAVQGSVSIVTMRKREQEHASSATACRSNCLLTNPLHALHKQRHHCTNATLSHSVKYISNLARAALSCCCSSCACVSSCRSCRVCGLRPLPLKHCCSRPSLDTLPVAA